ncbi:glycoside hydrolase family 140 protein [Chryseolinea sp. T2]|uniref:glycoside hydrolase family 140 protein n=1 Tax=Chryseolinea sp. T2 TaxID=3129255 RepID=UPI0030787D3E
MKIHLSIVLAIAVLFPGSIQAQTTWKHGRLHVTPDKTGFQYRDGTPFFWLGDTGWELLNRLTTEEAIHYLDDRAEKGFNVIQITGLSLESLERKNRYGEQPLHNRDPLKPNEAYFTRLDTIVKLALDRQLVIGLVVTWGDKVVRVPGYGADPIIFDEAKARFFGNWMARRYAQFPNIVWILGGDVAAVREEGDFRSVWGAMAEGIISGTGKDRLITYHPSGYRSSSAWFNNTEWLDFNMIQSSHGEHDAPTWEFVATDLKLTPKKPTLDAEPNYEDHPAHPWPKWEPDSGYFRDYDVRKQLYRSVFAGAAGVTYGHHAVWQFLNEREEVGNYADRGWVNALDRPGARQVKYLKYLMESYPASGRERDLSIIIAGQGNSKKDHAEAFRAASKKYAMIYLPVGKEISVNATQLTGKRTKAYWYNPRNGEVTVSATLTKSSSMKFTPPSSGAENDWILILEDADSNSAAFSSYKKK